MKNTKVQMADEERAKKYGKRLKYDLLPIKYLKNSEGKGEISTNYYQGIFLHKEYGQAINVVIIVKINVKTQKVGHAILFSSDVELGWEKLVDYYSLRFQIEFNFRDARATFRFGRFYEHNEKRSRKCGKFIVSDGQCECQIVKKQGKKMCRNK